MPHSKKALQRKYGIHAVSQAHPIAIFCPPWYTYPAARVDRAGRCPDGVASRAYFFPRFDYTILRTIARNGPPSASEPVPPLSTTAAPLYTHFRSRQCSPCLTQNCSASLFSSTIPWTTIAATSHSAGARLRITASTKSGRYSRLYTNVDMASVRPLSHSSPNLPFSPNAIRTTHRHGWSNFSNAVCN